MSFKEIDTEIFTEIENIGIFGGSVSLSLLMLKIFSEEDRDVAFSGIKRLTTIGGGNGILGSVSFNVEDRLMAESLINFYRQF